MSALRKKHRDGGPYTRITMVEFDHPDGVGRFWFGTGVIDFEGNAYHGAAIVGSITSVRTTIEIEIVERTFSVSGVDRDIVAGLSKSVKGRPARIYEALIDEHMRVVERDLVDETQMDTQHYAMQADGKCAIGIKAHGGMFFLLNRSAAKWGPEEAKAIWPDESGFDAMHIQEDIQDRWSAE